MSSQGDEDKIIEAINEKLGIEKGTYFEVGVNTGKSRDSLECNSVPLINKGWSGILIDAACKHPQIHNSLVSVDNISDLMNMVEGDIDFASMDIDSFDWYVVREMLEHEKNVRYFCVEVNNYHPIDADKIMSDDLDPNYYFALRQTPYRSRCFGATALAYQKLFEHYGYKLVAQSHRPTTNAFFVKAEDAKHFERAGDLDYHWKPSTHNVSKWGKDLPNDKYKSAEKLL